MAPIKPNTSLQSFPINKYTNSSYGGGGTCPDSISLEVQYKVTAVSGNTTTLQITLILHHAQINIKAGSNDCYFKIGTQEVQWTGPNLYSTTSGNTTTLGTKTITITHDSDGTFANKTFIVRYRLNATYSGVTMYYITNYNMSADYKTITLDPRYSACTAPTSVSISGGSPQKPGNITITWSGATAGTNMSISKYRVYYAIGSVPTASSSYQDTTSATASLTFNATSRGSTYHFKIKTIGSVSGYDSDLSAEATCVINQLPNAPILKDSSQVVISNSSKTITSTTNDFSVIATAGAANTGFSTTSVYYATSAGGTKAKYNSALPMNPNAGSSLTYYFWTWDGAEYSSSYTYITITKNRKPLFTCTDSAVNTFEALNTSPSSYFLGWSDYITPKIKITTAGSATTKTYTITKTIQVKAISNFTTSFSDSGTTTLSLTETKSLTSGASASTALTSVDPYTCIYQNSSWRSLTTSSNNLAWRIALSISDGIESSATVYFPSDNKYYAIPKMSTIQSTTLDGNDKLFKVATLTLDDETSTSAFPLSVTVKVNNATTGFSYTTSYDNNNHRLITITLSSAPGSGESKTFTIIYSKSNITKTVSTTVTTRTTPATFGTLSCSNDTLKPFSSTTDFDFTITWPFSPATTIPNAKTTFNIDTIDLILIKNNVTYAVSATASKVNDKLQLTITGTNFYPWTSENNLAWGVSSYSGKYEYSAKIRATSSYGETFVSNPINFYVDFKKQITSLSIEQIVRVYNPTPSTEGTQTMWTPSSSDTRGLAEGNICRVAFSYNGYTRDTTTIAILFNDIQVKTYEISNNAPGHDSYSINELNNTTFTVPEVKSATSTIKIIATNSYGLEYGSEEVSVTNLKTVKHTSPNMSLTSLEINDNGFSGTVNIQEFGVSTAPSNPFRISDGTATYTADFSSTVTSPNFSFSNIACTNNNWDIKALTLKYTSTVTIYSNTSTNTTSSSKTFYLNYVTVYKASPTVAYRKNRIGINTSSPISGSILDIHQSSSNSDIYFQGSREIGNSLVPITWKFDVSEGIIRYTRDTTNYTLDLTNLLTIGTGATDAAAGDHAHGSITNVGAITGNTAIATNDRIVFADNSDSSKLKRSTIVFDTNVTNKYLSQAGTWADSLSTTTLTATGAISGASITTTGNGSIGGSLDVAGNITFDDGSQTAERSIRFKNATDSTYYHNTTIYGGNPTSTTSIGIWDTAHSHSVMYYTGSNGTVGFLDDQAAINRGADFRILGKSVSWYQKFMQSLPQNTNLNDIIAPGIYHQSSSSYATLALNYPVTTAGLLEVFQGASTTFIYQRYTPYTGHYCFQRCRYSNTWYPWHSLKPTEITAWGNADDTPNLNTLWPQNGYSVYCVIYSADATTAKNFPTSSSGFLEVMRDYSASERYIQRFTTYNSSAIYIRHYYNSAWSAWKKTFPVVYSGTDPTTTGIHTATVSANFNSSGVASVTVSGVTTSSHVIAQRVATSSQTGNSWSVAAAVPTAANTVRLVQSSATTASSVSINIIWW